MLSLRYPETPALLDEAVRLAAREVADLASELETGLTERQSSLLHQLRLSAESLGALRAALLVQRR